MRNLIVSIALFMAAATVSAQSEQPADSIRGISMENYKEFKDGFLLDMGMMIATPPPLLPPQAGFDFRSFGTTKDYNELFRLQPAVTYGRGNLNNVFSGGMYGTGIYGFGTYHSGSMPPALQSATFKLKNGLRITTYGEYDADGNKVRNPGALPWERNNFNGAIEVKSANGNFGIRLGVQQERAPY